MPTATHDTEAAAITGDLVIIGALEAVIEPLGRIRMPSTVTPQQPLCDSARSL